MEDKAINQCSSSSKATETNPESTLQLNIKTLESQTYTFQVNQNETVSLFKEKIASKVGVPVGQQRLIFRGRVLKDDQPLSEYHLENGHTLHLVIRQPVQSQPSSGIPSQGPTGTDGNGTNGGELFRNRGSHSLYLGSVNVGDPMRGIFPDISQVIGAVLNSVGAGGQQPSVNTTNGTNSSTPSNLAGQTPPGNTPDGAPGTGGQSQAQAAGHSQPRQAFPGATFQASSPNVFRIPATTIPIPSFQTPIPDSLDTLMEFINLMEQALSQNGIQPNTSVTSEDRPRVELHRNRHGLSTPEALSVVLRNAQHLLSGPTVSSLSHIAGRLEQDGSSSDLTIRTQIQTEAVQAGLAMQHLGALLLELGRTTLTLRMTQSPELAYVNAGPAVYISPSGPNPIMVQPFPHQTSPLFSGASATLSAPLTGSVGLGTATRNINIHIHAGTSASPLMSSVGEGGQGERVNNPSSFRVLPVRSTVGAVSTGGGNVSAGVQVPGSVSDSGASIVTQIMRDMLDAGGRTQLPLESFEGGVSTDSGVANATAVEQPISIAASGSPSERSNNSTLPSDKVLGGGHSSALIGEFTSNEEVATGDSESTNKAIPEVAPAKPLGLGLGGLDRKKRCKQPKELAKNDGSGTSASFEGVEQSSGPNLLQSLFTGTDDRVDVSSVMSQVLDSPALDGLLSGVSRQAGVDSPNMMRNMLQQFTQNPQLMNTVQQIAQQVDGQEIENIISGGRVQGAGGLDFSRIIQQMMPLVSRAFSQGGVPSLDPATQQVNVESIAEMIEHSNPPEDVFRAMVDNAGMSQEELNELCSDEVLSREYADLLRRDIQGRLKEDAQGS